jgi:hypothetical protein
VAAVLSPLVLIFRRSVLEAFVPRMSRLKAAATCRGMLELNSRGNVLVGMVVYPSLAFVFAFAEDLVTLVYTAAYLEAAPVMRVYIVGVAIMVVELTSVLLLLRQGSFALGVNTLALIVSAAASWTLAGWVGLAGAAGGSVLAIIVDRLISLRRISLYVGVPVRELQDWRGLASRARLRGRHRGADPRHGRPAGAGRRLPAPRARRLRARARLRPGPLPLEEAMKRPLLYIHSASHSGSTLLAQLLARHPEVATVGELSGTVHRARAGLPVLVRRRAGEMRLLAVRVGVDGEARLHL